jgi:hypothetical protein
MQRPTTRFLSLPGIPFRSLRAPPGWYPRLRVLRASPRPALRILRLPPPPGMKRSAGMACSDHDVGRALSSPRVGRVQGLHTPPPQPSGQASSAIVSRETSGISFMPAKPLHRGVKQASKHPVLSAEGPTRRPRNPPDPPDLDGSHPDRRQAVPPGRSLRPSGPSAREVVRTAAKDGRAGRGTGRNVQGGRASRTPSLSPLDWPASSGTGSSDLDPASVRIPIGWTFGGRSTAP